jgi:hypothetical protein
VAIRNGRRSFHCLSNDAGDLNYAPAAAAAASFEWHWNGAVACLLCRPTDAASFGHSAQSNSVDQLLSCSCYGIPVFPCNAAEAFRSAMKKEN